MDGDIGIDGYRPFYHWDNWYYGPWHNPSYNVIWNSSRQNVGLC